MPDFSAHITLRNGTILYAKDYGIKAFPIGGGKKNKKKNKKN
jgi:hypothetical protein